MLQWKAFHYAKDTCMNKWKPWVWGRNNPEHSSPFVSPLSSPETNSVPHTAPLYTDCCQCLSASPPQTAGVLGPWCCRGTANGLKLTAGAVQGPGHPPTCDTSPTRSWMLQWFVLHGDKNKPWNSNRTSHFELHFPPLQPPKSGFYWRQKVCRAVQSQPLKTRLWPSNLLLYY